MGERSSRNLIPWVFLVYFLISVLMVGWLLWPFVATMVLAAVVTGIFNPLFHFLRRKLNPIPASLTTCLVIFVVLFVPIVLCVGILSAEAYDFYVRARNTAAGSQLNQLLTSSDWIERINAVLANFNLAITADELNRAATEIGRSVGLFLYEQARIITSNILKFLINFFFMLLICFYLFIDQQRLLAFIIDLSPLPDEQDRQLFQKFRDMAGAILIGNGLSGLIQGLVGGALFALFGIASPFIWGVVMALLAFLPIVGIGAVFIPAAVILILKGRLAAGIFFVIFYVILSGVIEYLFKPKIVGHRVRMHTLLVFLSIIGGLQLFGILGIIFGPLIITGFLTLIDIYRASYQKLVLPVPAPDK